MIKSRLFKGQYGDLNPSLTGFVHPQKGMFGVQRWGRGQIWRTSGFPEKMIYKTPGEDSSSPLFPTMMVINRGFLAKTSTFDTPRHATQFYVSVTVVFGKLASGIRKLEVVFGNWYSETGSGIRKLDSGIRKLDSGIRKLGSGIRKLGSGIRKLDSGIRKLVFGNWKWYSETGKWYSETGSGIGKLEKGILNTTSSF